MNAQKLYYIKVLLFGLNSVFQDCKKYLKKGTYLVSSNFCVLKNSELNDENFVIFSDFHKESNSIKKIISNIISRKKYVVIDDNNENQGELIIISSSRKQYKIFDFINKQVITKYKSKEKYFDLKEKYKYIQNIYHIADILEFNDKNLIMKEQYLNNEYSSKENMRVFKTIINSYIANSEKFKKNKSNNNIKSSKLNKFELLNAIHNYLKCQENDFIKIRCHGDLWSSNVIHCANELYYIDFEMVGYYSFFYDIFFFMFSEAYLKQDFSLIINYINGYYDEILNEYFKAFNQNYEIDKKDVYLLYFIYEYALSKWAYLSNKKIKQEIEKLKNLLDKLGIVVGGTYGN